MIELESSGPYLFHIVLCVHLPANPIVRILQLVFLYPQIIGGMSMNRYSTDNHSSFKSDLGKIRQVYFYPRIKKGPNSTLKLCFHKIQFVPIPMENGGVSFIWQKLQNSYPSIIASKPFFSSGWKVLWWNLF